MTVGIILTGLAVASAVVIPLVISTASATMVIILTPLAVTTVGIVGYGVTRPAASEPHLSLLELSSAHTRTL